METLNRRMNNLENILLKNQAPVYQASNNIPESQVITQMNNSSNPTYRPTYQQALLDLSHGKSNQQTNTGGYQNNQELRLNIPATSQYQSYHQQGADPEQHHMKPYTNQNTTSF
jgi:hypothetical protein